MNTLKVAPGTKIYFDSNATKELAFVDRLEWNKPYVPEIGETIFLEEFLPMETLQKTVIEVNCHMAGEDAEDHLLIDYILGLSITVWKYDFRISEQGEAYLNLVLEFEEL